MTGKHGSSSRPGGASDPESPSTLRSIEVAEATSPDNESPGLPVYYEPQPLVAVSDHKTIEVETVKLADEIDPRKLVTELRLARPPSVAPPDSNGPQTDVVVISSSPPLAGRRRWRTPVVLLVLFGALMLLVLARSAAQRAHAAAAPPSSAAAPAETSASATTVASEPPNPMPSVAATAIPEPAVAPKPRAGKPLHGLLKSSSHSSIDPAPDASSRVLTAPSASKPKRAIY